MATDMNKKVLSVGDEVKFYDNSYAMKMETIDSIKPSWVSNHEDKLRHFSSLQVRALDLKVPSMDYHGIQETYLGEKQFLDIMVQDPDGNLWLSQSELCKKIENKPSKYARFFDMTSVQWTTNLDHNLFFIKAQMNYANDLLKARGYLFLNEVYDMLGLSRNKAGQMVGWLFNGDGDNYVAFTITTQENSSNVLLDFNVDGVIWDFSTVMEDKKQVQPNPEILVEEGKYKDDLHVWCDKKYDAAIKAMPGIYSFNDLRLVSGYVSIYIDHRYNKVIMTKQIQALAKLPRLL